MADLKPLPTRDGFGEEMVVLGREDKNIVVVSADLEDATRAEYFKKEFPEITLVVMLHWHSVVHENSVRQQFDIISRQCLLVVQRDF